MNSMIVVLCAALAVANAGLLGHHLVSPIADEAVIKGPGASASVHGPDGSVITSHQEGGAVAKSAAVVAHAAPIAHAGVIAHHAPLIAHAGLVAHHAPVVAHHGAAVVAARLAAPGVIAHHGLHHGVVGAPVLARAGLIAHGYPALAPGSGLEGQYVHDFTETLYDDGQYHGEIYH